MASRLWLTCNCSGDQIWALGRERVLSAPCPDIVLGPWCPERPSRVTFWRLGDCYLVRLSTATLVAPKGKEDAVTRGVGGDTVYMGL